MHAPPTCRRRRRPGPLPPRALVTPDPAPAWTLDQIAGLVFGAGMLAAFGLAGTFDAAVARGQRRELGVCARCGGVNEAASCPEKECPLRREAGK